MSTRQIWIARTQAWLSDLRRHESQMAMVLSLVIGAVVGLVIVVFILVTGRLAEHLYPTGSQDWRRAVLPVIGALVSGFLLFRFFPNARGSGIPQTKAALYSRDGKITLHTVVGKFVCCSTSLASGIALGREGPSVQIGSGIASVLGRRLGLSNAQVKALIPVGSAAALAAAFNTPIAAVLFSLEEIVGDLHAAVLGSVVLSSATAWMVLHLLLGDEPLFRVAAYTLASPWEFIAYAVLGIAGGMTSAFFTRFLLRLRRRFLALPQQTRWIQPVAGGLAVGLMGYFVPEVLGVGYATVETVLAGSLLLKTVVLLLVLKLVATVVCYASGNAGGIFGPSLFIGAMLGAAVGHLAHLVAPAHTGNSGAYALVGMGAMFAGVVRTPLTSVIMIFELTRDYSIIVPLMIANLVSFYISHRFQRATIYEALATQDGIHLPAGASSTNTRDISVESSMRPLAQLLSPESTIGSTVGALQSSGTSDVVMFDQASLYRFTAEVLQAAMSHGNGGDSLRSLIERTSGAIISPGSPHVHADQELSLALQRIGDAHLEVLPVVSREDASIVVGALTVNDILAVYGLRAHSIILEEQAAAGPRR